MTQEQLKKLKELNDNLANDFRLVEHYENDLSDKNHRHPDFFSITRGLEMAREFLNGSISRMKEFMKEIDND